jgi:hypothetical protein
VVPSNIPPPLSVDELPSSPPPPVSAAEDASGFRMTGASVDASLEVLGLLLLLLEQPLLVPANIPTTPVATASPNHFRNDMTASQNLKENSAATRKRAGKRPSERGAGYEWVPSPSTRLDASST